MQLKARSEGTSPAAGPGASSLAHLVLFPVTHWALEGEGGSFWE